MNDQQLSQALTQLVADRKHVAPTPALSEKIWAIPEMTTRQRSWLPQSPKWRFQSMFSVTKFVVAGAIVALFGGFLLAGVLTQPSEEQPAVGASASVSPEPAPVVIDAFDVGGYVDSLVGSQGAVWVAGGDGPVRRIDPVTREVTEVVPEGSGIRHLVPTADAVWAVGQSLMRIDPASAEVTDTLPLVAESLWPPPVADGSIWIGGDGVLYEVDIESRELVNEYVGHGGGWSGVIDGAIWLWGGEQGLVRFDLDTREFSDPFPVPALDWGYEECCVVAEDAIWLIAGPGELAMRFDLSTLEITDTIDLRRSGSTYPDEGIAVGDAVWIPHGDGVVYRIDARSREITDTVTVDGRPLDRMLYVDGAIWVATWDSGVMHRIDPESRVVTHTLDVGGEPSALAEFDGAIWVAGGEGTLTRIGIGTDAPEQMHLEASPVIESPDVEQLSTPDLLPGVDLVTEEVEPGVYRVLSDGIRDLSGIGEGRRRGHTAPDGLAVAPDGAVWLHTVPAASDPRDPELIRLGNLDSYPLPSQSLLWGDLDLGPDGTPWGWVDAGLSRLDGEGWSAVLETDASETDAWGMAADGTLQIVSSEVLQKLSDVGADVRPSGEWVFVVAPDGDVWAGLTLDVDPGEGERDMALMRYDGETWSLVDPLGVGTYSVVLPQVGADGTVWVNLETGWVDTVLDPDHRYLARYVDGRWTVSPTEGGFMLFSRGDNLGLLRVDHSGTAWVRPDLDRGGVRAFDGRTWGHYLDGQSVDDMEVAPDGNVWVLSDDLYVITPEAVAAAEE